MKSRTEEQYVQLFQYMNEKIGAIKCHIVKLDLEMGLQNSVAACFKFDFFGSCRFHMANIIRKTFKNNPCVSKLMFRKNRVQQHSVEEHLVQTTFQTLKSLMLLQPAIKTQIIEHIKKRNNTCTSTIQSDLSQGQFRIQPNYTPNAMQVE